MEPVIYPSAFPVPDEDGEPSSSAKAPNPSNEEPQEPQEPQKSPKHQDIDYIDFSDESDIRSSFFLFPTTAKFNQVAGDVIGPVTLHY